MTKKNSTKTESTTSTVDLGNGFFTIVDRVDLPMLRKFTWHAVQGKRSWYAKTIIYTGNKTYTLSMHRLIAKPRRDQITHHINHNTLDNRRSNFVNLDRNRHTSHHQSNNLQVKYSNPSAALFGGSMIFAPISPGNND